MPDLAIIRILVIEDNADDELLLMRLLRKAKMAHQVHVVKNGRTAIEYLTEAKSSCEDLIALFMDIDLPGADGLEVLKQVRECQGTEHLALFAMTSSLSPLKLKKCKELGNARSLQKPLTISSFSNNLADLFHCPLAA